MTKVPAAMEDVKEEKLDFFSLAKTLAKNRTIILKVVGLFFLIGFFLTIIIPREFSTSTIFVPHGQGSGSDGGLGGLASLAGLKMGGLGAGSEIPPTLYPDIVTSVNFQEALVKTPITLENGEKMAYFEYYEKFPSVGLLGLIKKYTIGLPSLLVGGTKETEDSFFLENEVGQDDIVRYSKHEVKHFRRLKNQLEVSPNMNKGTVEIKVTMPEQLMAAEMTKAAQELLQREVIAYKIQNAVEQLNYAQKQFEEKRAVFEEKQRKLANFKDKNQNISSALAMNQLQRLEAEYNFAFNLYTEMAKQYEQAKIQVSKDTPVFSVIKPVNLPAERSGPGKILLIVVFTFLGVFAAVGYVFLKQLIKNMEKRWQQY